MDDQEIIVRIRKGEVELFRVLVDRYHQSLLRFIQTITRSSFLTEDIGQSVFFSFFQTLEKFDVTQKTPVKAWLFTAARNQAINVIKKERRYVLEDWKTLESCDSKPGPLDLLIAREDRVIFYQSIEHLEEPYRSTLLESLQGYSINKIAQKKMIMPGTVKSRLARAREKIKRHLRIEMEKHYGSL